MSISYFREAAAAEVDGNKAHPLNILKNVTDAELQTLSFGSLIDSGELYGPVNHLRRKMLATACAEFYNDFDKDLYESFEKPTNAILTCVWGRYRYLVRKREEGLAVHKLKNEALERESKMLQLGHGDLAAGCSLFQSRRDTSSYYDTGDFAPSVSDALTLDFAKFTSSKAFELWRLPAADPGHPKPFVHGRMNSHVEEVFKMSEEDIEGGLLEGLCDILKQDDTERQNVSVWVTFKWDVENTPPPLQSAYMTNAHEAGVTEAIPLVNQELILQNPVTFDVLDVRDGLVVTSKKREVHRWFPHKFRKFTSENPSFPKRYSTNVCFEYAGYVHQVTVQIGDTRYVCDRRTGPNLSTLDDVLNTFEAKTDLVTCVRVEASNNAGYVWEKRTAQAKAKKAAAKKKYEAYQKRKQEHVEIVD